MQSNSSFIIEMKLLLFDLDGTLMLSGGAGARAIDRAFAELYRIEGAFGEIVPDGKTDPLIFREIIANHGLAVADESAAFAELERVYARHLSDEMPRSDAARLMPGVHTLLERLQALDQVSLGLLTGNFEATARIKLAHFGLNRFFPFGAFASDNGDRSRLVPIAVRRAENHLGRSIDLGRHVVVIGDTPRDVECALIHGATAIGIAASRYTADDLAAVGAHHVLPTLEDVDAFLVAAGIVEPA
jgi:phosphoglycolate phosphatase-like HAD superfamily hydrolase